MSLAAADITIAVTVYSRRDYVRQAVASTLAQTVPVQVMVVEDCGPDPGLRAFLEAEFGSRITYHRNPVRRGLFGNWNACLEYCRTPWLSILQDDDWLTPVFVETMQALHATWPEADLLHGGVVPVDEAGQALFPSRSAKPDGKITLEAAQWGCPFTFPGQLFRVDAARAAGGFRVTSQFCGDWEMWAQLMGRKGAACSGRAVSYFRTHAGMDRGTNVILRQGRWYPLSVVQQKRVFRLRQEQGETVRFDRAVSVGKFPLPARYLLQFGAEMSPRLLAYHTRIFQLSRPAWLGTRFLRALVRSGGTPLVRAASRIWRRLAS